MAAGQSSPGHPYKVVCVPARDEADEIVGTMLAQLIERAGHEAQCVPLGSAAEMLAQVKEENRISFASPRFLHSQSPMLGRSTQDCWRKHPT